MSTPFVSSHVLLIGSMVFWLVRMSVRKRVKQNIVIDAGQGAIVSRPLGATGMV
jgi:hypothetical protein